MSAAHSISTRLYSKLVWWWERRSIPSERTLIWTLSPLPVAREGETELLIFTTPAALVDALWAARSVLVQLPDLRLCLALDGPVEPAERARLERLLPGVELASAPALAATCAPRLAAFARANAMGRKLAVVTARQRERSVLYCDSDVLAFAPLAEVAEAIPARSARHIQCVEGTCLDPALKARTDALGLPLCPSLNGGFYHVPRGGFDEPLVERLLDGLDPAIPGWFGETTLTAALLQRLESQPLPRERYVVSLRRQFVTEQDVDYGQIALRHFVTPVRPLFYRRGLRLLWSRWKPKPCS